jgi:hypothetical protein
LAVTQGDSRGNGTRAATDRVTKSVPPERSSAGARGRGADRVDGAEQRHRHRPLEVLSRRLREPAVGAGAGAGVGDDDVETAELRLGLGDGGLDRGGVGNVGLDDVGDRTVSPGRPGGRLQARAPAGDERQVGAGRRESAPPPRGRCRCWRR